jgi:hypothetical protein
MIHPDSAKPATVSSEPALNVEQLGGPLIQTNTELARALQAQKLCRLYFFCRSTAISIAALAYGVCR